MPFPSEVFLFLILIICGVLVAKEKNLFAAAMLTGLFSLTSACLFTLMDAVDVAFTEAAVGAGISTVLVLLPWGLQDGMKTRGHDHFSIYCLFVDGTALAVGIMNMALHGNDDAPIHRNVTAKIVQVEWNAVKEKTHGHPQPRAPKRMKKTSAIWHRAKNVHGHCAVRAVGLPNLVTSILGVTEDTTPEYGVIFTAGVMLLSRVCEEEEPAQRSTGSEEPQTDDQSAEDDAPVVDVDAETAPEPELNAELLEDDDESAEPSGQDEEEVQA